MQTKQIGLAMAVVALCGGFAALADDKDKKDASKVVLTRATNAEVEKHVAAQKGKPVAMDVWATYCVPCREKFPKFQALAAKHKEKASFLSLTIDDEEQFAAAERFLKGKNATFNNFLAKDGAEAVEKKYGFEGVPQYLVWDAAGKLVLKTDDLGKVEEKLKDLLAEKKSDA